MLKILAIIWQPLAIIIIVGGIFTWVFQSGVSSGKKDAEAVYLQENKDRDKKINDSIEKLAIGSAKIAENGKLTSTRINKKIQALSDDVKNNINKEPLVIYKEGNCVPSKSFVDTMNRITEEANAKK